MYKLPVSLAAAGLLGLTAIPASATLSTEDREFVQKAASGGMAEVQAAQLAQQRGGSPQVKQFAERMVADHTQANSELRQIAKQDSIAFSQREL